MRSSDGRRKCILQKLVTNSRFVHDFAFMFKNRNRTIWITLEQPVRLVLQVHKHRFMPTIKRTCGTHNHQNVCRYNKTPCLLINRSSAPSTCSVNHFMILFKTNDMNIVTACHYTVCISLTSSQWNLHYSNSKQRLNCYFLFSGTLISTIITGITI